MSPLSAVRDVAAGFHGKIPSRGDFVRGGLSSRFVAVWDEWMSRALAGSRARLGEPAWLAAWMQAPIWRFLIDGGLAGPDAVLGVMLPSVDRAGRYFPLTLAATAPNLADLALHGGAFLDAAEQVGLDALEQDLAPADIAARLDLALDSTSTEPPPSGVTGRAVWWTDGSPLVEPVRLSFPQLPGDGDFTRMLDDGSHDAAPSAIPA